MACCCSCATRSRSRRCRITCRSQSSSTSRHSRTSTKCYTFQTFSVPADVTVLTTQARQSPASRRLASRKWSPSPRWPPRKAGSRPARARRRRRRRRGLDRIVGRSSRGCQTATVRLLLAVVLVAGCGGAAPTAIVTPPPSSSVAPVSFRRASPQRLRRRWQPPSRRPRRCVHSAGNAAGRLVCRPRMASAHGAKRPRPTRGSDMDCRSSRSRRIHVWRPLGRHSARRAVAL